MTQNPDGSLSYKAPDGSPARVGIFDANYGNVFAIFDKQSAAVKSNALKLSLYTLYLAGSQEQVARGVIVPAPTKPTMEVVDDQGNDTQVPWVPPLPDLVLPTSTPVPSGGIVATTGLPPDYVQESWRMLKAIYAKEFPA